MLTPRQVIQNGGALLTLHAAALAFLRAQSSPLADTQAFVTKAEDLKPVTLTQPASYIPWLSASLSCSPRHLNADGLFVETRGSWIFID